MQTTTDVRSIINAAHAVAEAYVLQDVCRHYGEPSQRKVWNEYGYKAAADLHAAGGAPTARRAWTWTADGNLLGQAVRDAGTHAHGWRHSRQAQDLVVDALGDLIVERALAYVHRNDG